MQRFIPSRLLIARCTHLWKVSASGKTLLHLALVLGIPFGIMGDPHGEAWGHTAIQSRTKSQKKRGTGYGCPR